MELIENLLQLLVTFVGALLSGGIWDVPVWERVTVRHHPDRDEVLDFTTHPRSRQGAGRGIQFPDAGGAGP